MRDMVSWHVVEAAGYGWSFVICSFILQDFILKKISKLSHFNFREMN